MNLKWNQNSHMPILDEKM